MRGVAAMMADAGVTVDWRDCSRGGDAHPCRTVRGAHDLVVRIMPAFVARASGDAARKSRPVRATCSSALPRSIPPDRST